MYEYTATVLRVIDGDTVWLDVDLGFDVKRKDSFRLAAIDAPEISTPEGVAARDHLVRLLHGGGELTITTHKDKREKFGRYLATLWLGHRNLNVEMVIDGHAQPYRGRAKPSS